MDSGGQLWREILRSVWWLVRAPIVTLLVILEPAVSLVFGGLALLGLLHDDPLFAGPLALMLT